VQAIVIPIADRHVEYASQVRDTLTGKGFRVEVDSRGERMNYKIRDAQLQKVPYMLVVGDREMEAGAVAVRHRDQGDLGTTPIPDLLDRLSEEVESRT
jgi:threonyl-tRNA synthetase